MLEGLFSGFSEKQISLFKAYTTMKNLTAYQPCSSASQRFTGVIILLLVLFGFAACKQRKTGIDKQVFLGSWNFSEHIPFDKLKEMPDFKDGLDGVKDAEMNLTGKTQYHTNGQYNTSGEMTFRITVAENGQNVNMKFNIREAGKWQVTDSVITETTEDGEITPADDITKSMAAEDPAMLKELRPVRGETTSDKIIVATPALIELFDPSSKLKMTMRKTER